MSEKPIRIVVIKGSVRPNNYTSMAVAALQEQHREIEGLKREIQELRAELRGRAQKKATADPK